MCRSGSTGRSTSTSRARARLLPRRRLGDRQHRDRTTGSRARSPGAPAASSSRSTTGSRPSIRYPAALDDAWTAAEWVIDERRRARHRPRADRRRRRQRRRRAGGDRARGRVATPALPFAAQLLLYPVDEPRGRTRRRTRSSRSATGSRATRWRWYWQQYLGEARTASPTPTSHRRRCRTSAGCRGRSSSPPRPTSSATRRETYAQRLVPGRRRDRGVPLRRHDPRLPADGRRASSARTRRSTRSPSRWPRRSRKGWRERRSATPEAA